MKAMKNSLKPGVSSPRITLMNEKTTQISQRALFATDSSKRTRALEKFRQLNEATIQALRQAGLEREQREEQAKPAKTH